MFANQKDAVDGQPLAAQRQRAGHRIVDGKAVLAGQPPTHVVIGKLIDIGADQLELGKFALAIERVALHEARGEHVGVRIVPPDGGDDGDARDFVLSKSRCGK